MLFSGVGSFWHWKLLFTVDIMVMAQVVLITPIVVGNMEAYVKTTRCTLILVTHSLQQARRIADEVLYLHRGKLLESGPKEQLLYHPAQPETKTFLDFYGA